MAEAPGTLYDPTGVKIPPTAPAPPASTTLPDGVEYGLSDRSRAGVSRGLTPKRIEQFIAEADAGDPFNWVQLCEEMIEKDAKIASVFHTRTAAVLGLVHEVRPVKLDDESSSDQALAEQIAQFSDDALDRACVDDLLGDMQDALGKPMAADWIDWGNDANGKVVPLRFRRIPPSHLRWSMYEDEIRIWAPSNPKTGARGDMGEPLEPYTTVRAINNERRDHPMRAGLMRSIVWLYSFKNTNIKDWVALADRFGTPQTILTLDPDDFANPSLYKAARAALNMIAAGARGVISSKWKLDVTAAAAKGATELFHTIIEYVDTAIAQLVLGHELSSQGSKGGGQLGISAANQVRQDIVEGDCAFLGTIIRRDLLTPMVGWNFGWENVRLTPYFVFDSEPPKDLVASANVLSTVSRTFPTFEVSKQQLRDEYGYDAPIDEEDSITAGTAAAAGGDPINTPDVAAGTPDVSVNAVNRTLSRARRTRFIPRSSATARQKKVDQLTTKAIRSANTETAKWKAQLRTMIREGVKDGLSLADMTHRISKSYPDLDVARLEMLLHDELLLVRLFGRNA